MQLGFWPIIAVALEFVIKLGFVIAVLLRKKPRYASTIAWIAVILAIPLLGICAYLLVGEVRLGRRRRLRHQEICRHINQSSAALLPPTTDSHCEIATDFQHIAILAEAVGDNQPREGNTLELIGDTDLFIQSLVEDIDQAQHHCHLLYYIYLTDHSGRRVAESLKRAIQRGVTCRVIVDGVGSLAFLKSSLRREMEESGIKVVEALPAHFIRILLARVDLRNHRKIAVIDGQVGYLGSHNIADAEFAVKSRYAPWVDAGVRIVGPAVRDLQHLFITDWYMDTDESLVELLAIPCPPQESGVCAQIMGTGPNSFNEALRQLIQAAFYLAKEELITTTPYFVPDEATASALFTAAYRGVNTNLVLPARNDSPFVAAASQSHYESMLETGLKIYEFQEGLLHAKTVTIDRNLALITTANLDRRSFELNFEVSMVVYDSDFSSQLRFMQTDYMSRSQPVTLEQWSRRSLPRRLWQNAVGTLAPIL